MREKKYLENTHKASIVILLLQAVVRVDQSRIESISILALC